MDINELKFLLKHSASVVLMENGQPSLVIVDYNVYKSLLPSEPSMPRGTDIGAQPRVTNPGSPVGEQQFSPEEQEAVERLNREIQALKEQIAMEETGE
ncbi:MAG: hypothetical protein AAB864_00815 [Patescibacteria group bacterium]